MTSIRRLFVTLVLATVFLVPMSAGAAVVQPGVVDYQVWMAPEPGAAIVIVSVELSADASLPATVRLPVPTGMTVDWAGEVVGGDPSGDIERAFVLKDGDGGQYAEFEVTERRMAQIDVSGKQFAPAVLKVDIGFDLVHSVQADEYGFSVRIPSGVTDVKIEPAPVGTPEKTELGEALYTLKSEKHAPGEVTHVRVAYRTLAPGEESMSATNTVLLVLGGAAFVAIAVLMFVMGRQRAAQRHFVRDPEEDE